MKMIAAQNNFSIADNGVISRCFLDKGINNFNDAALFIRDLAYARNTDKNDLTTVFSDSCGTCSTKHAVLKQLAVENNFNNVELVMCLFKMNRKNSPSVKNVLDEYQLEYMPEAHNYLRVNGEVLDITKKKWDTAGIMDNVITETVILPEQISDYKVAWQKELLKQWLAENKHVHYSLDEFWEIREACIRALY